MSVQGRRVLLCVGGGIAAYKACELARLLVKAGAQVRVALTPAAQRFVTPLTFQALTGHPVATDLFSAEQDLAAGHIALADWAEMAVVAPCTANLLARLRMGQSSDAPTAALLAIPPRRWLIAPAMNEKMWAGPTREALDPVRFLSNPSSGKMGYALAEAARDRGAQVTLIAGPTALPDVRDVQLVHVESADDLARAVDQHVERARVVVMAAAV